MAFLKTNQPWQCVKCNVGLEYSIYDKTLGCPECGLKLTKEVIDTSDLDFLYALGVMLPTMPYLNDKVVSKAQVSELVNTGLSATVEALCSNPDCSFHLPLNLFDIQYDGVYHLQIGPAEYMESDRHLLEVGLDSAYEGYVCDACWAASQYKHWTLDKGHDSNTPAYCCNDACYMHMPDKAQVQPKPRRLFHVNESNGVPGQLGVYRTLSFCARCSNILEVIGIEEVKHVTLFKEKVVSKAPHLTEQQVDKFVESILKEPIAKTWVDKLKLGGFSVGGTVSKPLSIGFGTKILNPSGGKKK